MPHCFVVCTEEVKTGHFLHFVNDSAVVAHSVCILTKQMVTV